MRHTTKERAMAAIVMIASADGKNTLLPYTIAEGIYDAVVFERRWYRRLWNLIAP